MMDYILGSNTKNTGDLFSDHLRLYFLRFNKLVGFGHYPRLSKPRLDSKGIDSCGSAVTFKPQYEYFIHNMLLCLIYLGFRELSDLPPLIATLRVTLDEVCLAVAQVNSS